MEEKEKKEETSVYVEFQNGKVVKTTRQYYDKFLKEGNKAKLREDVTDKNFRKKAEEARKGLKGQVEAKDAEIEELKKQLAEAQKAKSGK